MADTLHIRSMEVVMIERPARRLEPMRVVACSAEIEDTDLFAIEKILESLGDRPVGIACEHAVFVTALDAKRVIIGSMRDHPYWENPAIETRPLQMRGLIMTRKLYGMLGDPFAIIARFPPNWQERGEALQQVWPNEGLPPRTIPKLQAILQAGDPPLLWGCTQAMVDGARVLITRSEPGNELIAGIWQLLPYAICEQRWFCTFSFAPSEMFDLVVVADEIEIVPGSRWLHEQQVLDYPESRYEMSLQTAIESGDALSMEKLFIRRNREDVIKYALFLLLFMIVIVTVMPLILR